MTRNNKLDDELDALFKLPLSDFIAARKELATRLKKDGRASEAERVKTLAKPSISAWTVNQLYWNYREEFDELLEAGQRFRKAQTSRQSSKVADMREALDARRESLAELSDLATTLLRDAGNNPSLETIRRVTTTLEAMSAHDALPNGASPGRLSEDIDPPGFESLAGFAALPSAAKSTSDRTSTKSAIASAKPLQKKTSAADAARIEKNRQAKLAAAKVSLQEAKKALTTAKSRSQSLEGQLKKAEAAAKEAEKKKREAEDQLKRASNAADQSSLRARNVAADAEEAKDALQDAERNVKKASQDLETLFREA